MSIVRLTEITWCGLRRDKERALERLQALGCLHIIPLSGPMKLREPERPRYVSKLRMSSKHSSQIFLLINSGGIFCFFSRRKYVDTNGVYWRSILAATGQPKSWF